MKIEHETPTISEYKNLRHSAGLWTTDVVLKNSLFSAVAIERDNVVGIGRIVGDGGFYYYIQDLIVHPEFQKNGIWKLLMGELMAQINSNAKAGAFIGLMAANGLCKYYEPYGLRR